MQIKITISDEEREVSVLTFHEHIDDIMRDIKGLLINWGFTQETVSGYFNDD